MGSIKVDKNYFVTRATRIYETWDAAQDGPLGDLEVLCFPAGSQDGSFARSQSMQTWLFNCNMPDTLIIVAKAGIYFLGSDKKAQFFSPLESKENENLNSLVPQFTALRRDKATKDQNNFALLLEVIKKGGNKVGTFIKEKPNTDFTKSWDEQIKTADITAVDVSLPFALLFAVKDDKEIAYLRRSAEASANSWNHLRKKLVEIVDTEKKIRHKRLADDLDQAMVSTSVQGRIAQDQALEASYTPIIQSGPECTLKFNAENTDKFIHYGSIVGSIGLRYVSYSSSVARTLMIEPSSKMEKVYELLVSAQTKLLEHLKPGTRICDAYKATVDFVAEKNADIANSFVKSNLGFVTGIEFRDPLLVINEKCQQTVQPSMTFVVLLGVQNFDNPDASDADYKKVSILLSDTVLIASDGSYDILTQNAKVRLRSNVIRFRAEGSSAQQPVNVEEGRPKRSVILQEQTRHKQTNEDKRKEHQRELADQVNEAARARLADMPGAEQEQRVKKSNISYKAQEKFPNESEVNEGKIFVDKKHDTVVLPIFGMPVPFHISMLKNTSMINEGDYTFLRINFTHPGSQIGKDNLLFTNPLADFVKELGFRASNAKEPGETNAPSANLQTAYRLIKELQKRFRTMEAEQREKEGTVKQDKLIVNNAKGNPKLKDVYVRPNIVSKRMAGALEAHMNGFRYTTYQRNDKIDVLYNNIKHAFFQPCDNEMIILLHFHLKNPVLWGKKKYNDIQFYTEVGEITTDLGKYHHMQDRDDAASEQMEREMRKKLNGAFQAFCEKVTRATNDHVDFETPFNELGFTGVPFRSSVVLKPTSTCLVSLSELPSLVVPLDDVELVHFERVTGNTRSFDMVVIYKDYQRKTQQIGHIPSASLDSVKNWLNSCDIRYTEGPMSLNWNNIMKTIVADPQEFFSNGGWDFLIGQSDAEDEGEESEESEFAPDGSSDAEESEESEDSDAADTEVEEESDSEAELSSGQSSGKEWSDLEEEAASADRAKERGEEEPRKRKHGASGGGGGGGGGGSSRPSGPPVKRRR